MSDPIQKQVCSIRLVFPVNDDEEAISYKKKILEVIAAIPDVQLQFTLMNMPAGLKPPM